MLGWAGRQSAAAEDDGTPSSYANDDVVVNNYTMSNNTNSGSSSTTKLSAKAANSLREKRRANNGTGGTPSSRPSSPAITNNISNGDDSDRAAGESESDPGYGPDYLGSGAAATTTTTPNTASSSNNPQLQQQQRSKVFSFFDPDEIRRPPNPASPMNRPPPSPSLPAPPMATISSNSEHPPQLLPNDYKHHPDSSTAGDDASVATSRIRNHNNNKHSKLVVATTYAAGGGGNENNTNNNNSMTPSSSARAFLASVDVAKEVKYEEGATELFMLVEDAKWEDVCSRIEYNPSEARVWVVSSGTENTVFSWSVWRRLALHEACRRQPPPVVIYALLAAYPESAMEENNFAELPLHAAVRCGACAEVVNCILASYPAGALAQDNSGCTPLDILNGIGKMMDHDAVVAALNRAIAVHTRETRMWEDKIDSMQAEFRQVNDKQKWDYERIIAEKKKVIENLERTSEQERLATSNLAGKVIQTEQVVQDKQKAEKRYQEKIRKYEEKIVALKSSNESNKSRVKELEETARSDATTILELNNRIKSLQSSLVSLVQDEEEFAAKKLFSAEKNFKLLVESQFIFLREADARKESIRARVKQLGVDIPPKKKSDSEPSLDEEEEMKKKKALTMMPRVEEVSNNEAAEKALVAAMAQLAHVEDEA